MNTHHIFLCDNMAVALCFDRFRARSWRLLVQIRRFASLALFMGVRPYVRWVLSEVDPAGAPGTNQVANIKSRSSTSALAQVSDLYARIILQSAACVGTSGP